jgi:capsid protein
MGFLNRFRKAGAALFAAQSGYDAVSNSGRRKPPSARVLSEDQELRAHHRRAMATGTRNLQRNFTIAAWAIRKHLDFLTSFSFQAKTGNKDLDKQVTEFVKWWSKPMNFDAAGRHGLRRFLRLVEARRTLDGDILVNRLADGRLQGIEGDRIQSEGGTPYDTLGIDPMKVVLGVYLNDNGRANGYMVYKRPFHRVALVWDKYIPALFADLVGYFDRFDQVRGISPMAPGINSLQDIYENFDYALAKAKVAQLFALAITRKASEAIGALEEDEEPATAPDGSITNGTTTLPQADDEARYKINFGKGPMVLDLDEGDDAKILQDQTPSDQFQAFTQAMIMVAIKALDLPFSFYDESHTNWVGQRQANAQYMLSASIKRQDLRDLLDKWTDWRLRMAVMDGDIELPAGYTASELDWDWVPTGIPPVDPLKEVTADVAEVNAGFSSPQRKCRERGDDYFQIIDEKAEAEQYAADKGVKLSTVLPQMFPDNTDGGSSGKQNDQQN